MSCKNARRVKAAGGTGVLTHKPQQGPVVIQGRAQLDLPRALVEEDQIQLVSHLEFVVELVRDVGVVCGDASNHSGREAARLVRHVVVEDDLEVLQHGKVVVFIDKFDVDCGAADQRRRGGLDHNDVLRSRLIVQVY
ncbi:hypothetical protein EYF80_004212 [Liparis tanakae]|uniref:Uncharacterized protein n=1 Tax=Liparis tanakae TaxID=230148 RepID=A0A4Z2J5U6_9TELE|nr:hypothetical protein EYF80_004212 [Liparis tanakae]